MEWVRLGKTRVKKVSKVEFINADCSMKNKSGPQRYKITRENQNDLFSRLLNLYLATDQEICDFIADYGYLGLYWYYVKYKEYDLPLEPFIQQLGNKPLYNIFSSDKTVSGRINMATKLHHGDIHALDVLQDEKEWSFYREPLQYIRFESLQLAEYADQLLNWETRTKDITIISDTIGIRKNRDKETFDTRRHFKEAELQKIDGKFYYVPISNTLLEYAYNMLPLLLNDDLPLRRCENETCQKFLVSRKKKHCNAICRNAQGRREDRQRIAISRRLDKGQSLEEAAKGYDWQKVLAWREKGLI